MILVAGLLVCAPSRVRAGNVFATCQAQAVARDGWKAVCSEGWVLTLADGRDELPVEEMLKILEQGLAGATKGKVIRGAGQVDLPGKGWTVTRLQVKEPKEQGPTFAVVAAGKLPAGSRVVSCMGLSETEETCKRAMQAAARSAWRSGPPATMPRDDSAPMFAGRPYRVPKGCEVIKQQNATAIGCEGEPVLFWGQQEEAFATLDSMLTGKLIESGMKEVAAVPCSVEGVSTKCRPFIPNAAGEPRSAYIARATVRAQPVIVVCLAGANTRPLPAACAAVLSLARPKP
jgi:hypothetical protein